MYRVCRSKFFEKYNRISRLYFALIPLPFFHSNRFHNKSTPTPQTTALPLRIVPRAHSHLQHAHEPSLFPSLSRSCSPLRKTAESERRSSSNISSSFHFICDLRFFPSQSRLNCCEERYVASLRPSKILPQYTLVLDNRIQHFSSFGILARLSSPLNTAEKPDPAA